VEVIAKAIRRDDKECLEFSSVPLINLQISNLQAVCHKFFFGTVDVGNQDCRTILTRISAVNSETDLRIVPFKDNCWYWLISPLDFPHAKRSGIPLSRNVEICYRQCQYIGLIWICFLK